MPWIKIETYSALFIQYVPVEVKIIYADLFFI
jgi:hypothetical protein